MTDDLITTRQMESLTPTPQSDPKDEETTVQPVTYTIYMVTMAMGVNAAPVAMWRARKGCSSFGFCQSKDNQEVAFKVNSPIP